MSEDDSKSGFVPKGQRTGGHAPLDPSEVEYLERLVQRGEGLLLSSLTFSQAESLIRTGHAKVVDTYAVGDDTIKRIEPTELGKTLAAVREATKLARLEAKPIPLPPTTEKS